MAIVIESTTAQATGASVTDVGSTGTFVVTKPSGVEVGDVLIIASYTKYGSAPPSGWNAITIPNYISTMSLLYKTADSADVSATNYTFTTTRDSDRYMYTCYRLTGVVTGADPVIVSGKVDVGNTAYPSIVATLDSPVITRAGALVLAFIGIYAGTDIGSPVKLSTVALTGGTAISITQRMNDAENNWGEDGAHLSDGIATDDSGITGITFTSDSVKDPNTFNVNVLVLLPPKDETGTNTLLENTNFIPAPSAESGTNGTVTDLLVGTPTIPAPTATSKNNKVWTNEARVSTTWTNESQ